MAVDYTKTNYHVKVQLDTDSPPTTDQIVIWDSGSEKFDLIDRDKLSGAGCFSYDLSNTSGGTPSTGEITFNSALVGSVTEVTASLTTFNSSTNFILLGITTTQNAYFSFTDENNNAATWVASNFTVTGTNVGFNVSNAAFPIGGFNFTSGPGIACWTAFGTSGSSGSSGTSGSSGSSGTSGSSGSSGTSGSSGSSGTSGSSGSSGTSGSSGSSGTSGSSGSSGTSGSSGSSGTSGSSGSSGTSGSSGSSGTSGSSGSSGTSGSSGSSGTSGSSGSSGTSGSSGSSGTSGESAFCIEYDEVSDVNNNFTLFRVANPSSNGDVGISTNNGSSWTDDFSTLVGDSDDILRVKSATNLSGMRGIFALFNTLNGSYAVVECPTIPSLGVGGIFTWDSVTTIFTGPDDTPFANNSSIRVEIADSEGEFRIIGNNFPIIANVTDANSNDIKGYLTSCESGILTYNVNSTNFAIQSYTTQSITPNGAYVVFDGTSTINYNGTYSNTTGCLEIVCIGTSGSSGSSGTSGYTGSSGSSGSSGTSGSSGSSGTSGSSGSSGTSGSSGSSGTSGSSGSSGTSGSSGSSGTSGVSAGTSFKYKIYDGVNISRAFSPGVSPTDPTLPSGFFSCQPDGTISNRNLEYFNGNVNDRIGWNATGGDQTYLERAGDEADTIVFVCNNSFPESFVCFEGHTETAYTYPVVDYLQFLDYQYNPFQQISQTFNTNNRFFRESSQGDDDYTTLIIAPTSDADGLIYRFGPASTISSETKWYILTGEDINGVDISEYLCKHGGGVIKFTNSTNPDNYLITTFDRSFIINPLNSTSKLYVAFGGLNVLESNGTFNDTNEYSVEVTPTQNERYHLAGTRYLSESPYQTHRVILPAQGDTTYVGRRYELGYRGTNQYLIQDESDLVGGRVEIYGWHPSNNAYRISSATQFVIDNTGALTNAYSQFVTTQGSVNTLTGRITGMSLDEGGLQPIFEYVVASAVSDIPATFWVKYNISRTNFTIS